MAEFQRLALLEQFKEVYGFTDEDLRANRAGTISGAQRDHVPDGNRFFRWLLIGLAVLVIFLTLALPASEGLSHIESFGIAVFLAVLFGWMPLLVWWVTARYPRGPGRVKMVIGEIYHHKPDEFGVPQKASVGHGIGARMLPDLPSGLLPPQGMLVRLYYNQGHGQTLVHSIEPAHVGDVSNMGQRNRRGMVLLGVLAVGLVGLFVFARAEEAREQQERDEQIQDFVDSVDESFEIEPLDSELTDAILRSLYLETEDPEVREEIRRDLEERGVPVPEFDLDFDLEEFGE